MFGSSLSILDLWSRPWGEAGLFGLRRVSPRPHPSEDVGKYHHHHHQEVKKLFRACGEDDLDEILSSNSETDEDDISPSTDVKPQVDSENEEPPAKRRRRNFSKKFINSIDSALNPNNYNILDLSDIEKKQFKVVLEKQSSKSLGHIITWTNDPPASCGGRLTVRNVISGPVGVRNEAKQCKTPIAAWELFFSANILSHIVKMTNKKISKKQHQSTSRSMITTSQELHR